MQATMLMSRGRGGGMFFPDMSGHLELNRGNAYVLSLS